MKCTNVFYQTYEAAFKAINGTGPRLIINQGGQGSSKTFSTLQAIYLLSEDYKFPLKTTFSSYALPHLKQGIISDFDKILIGENINIGEVKSQPSQPVYKLNKMEINCYGIEGNLAMAHGPRRDILFINECNRKVSFDVFDQLFSRSKITFLDFNPDREFWLHERVLANYPHVLIKSNFMDNEFLSEQERSNILMKKNKPGFENWWKVYGLGELGKLEGAILTDWKFGGFDNTLPFGYGLDFGFGDPDALVKIAIDRANKKIYAKQELYTGGLNTTQLVNWFESNINKQKLIVAESAAPRTVEDIKQRGFNIQKVVKGRIEDGIKILQDFEIIVDENSPDFVKELNSWIWIDKRGGIPLDSKNHLIDAMRYYVETMVKFTNRKANKVL